MTGISLDLPDSLTHLLKTENQTATHQAVDILRDYFEHEKKLTDQIELAVKEADQGKFAIDDQVATMRARRWSLNAG
ncbi:CopG family transcriptional regulator [Pseudomonas sp. MYb541]|uniref:CopG family transcriptional regulator n=1 Tax=Pseudomonas sp. MYb541 TaxID=2745402 RepID=UPI0030A395B0